MKPKTVEEYIKAAPKEVREKLEEMRTAVAASAPGATEGIKWSTIAFSYHRILVTFAAFKKHVGLYPTPSVMRHFVKELSKHKTGKGSIQFPLDQKLPTVLIKKIVKFRVKELREKDARWM